MRDFGYIFRLRRMPILIMLAVSFFNIGGSDPKSRFEIDMLTVNENVDNSIAMPAKADMVIIPLKNAGRLFMIEAIIDNESGNLIFDTGASGLVLNRTYFRKYLKSGEQNSLGITGSVGEADRVTAGLMNVSGLKYSKIGATLSDLSHIENRRGIKVLGLFGFELIKEFEVVIDINRNELQLFRIDGKGNPISAPTREIKYDISQKIEDYRNIVFIAGSVGGKILRFCLDSGAETNAIDRKSHRAVLETISIERKSSLTGAGTARAEVLFGKMNDFSIGSQPIKNMSTIITSLDALSEAYGKKIDGMLGYDFLINGPVRINFRKKQLDMQFVKSDQR